MQPAKDLRASGSHELYLSMSVPGRCCNIFDQRQQDRVIALGAGAANSLIFEIESTLITRNVSDHKRPILLRQLLSLGPCEPTALGAPLAAGSKVISAELAKALQSPPDPPVPCNEADEPNYQTRQHEQPKGKNDHTLKHMLVVVSIPTPPWDEELSAFRPKRYRPSRGPKIDGAGNARQHHNHQLMRSIDEP